MERRRGHCTFPSIEFWSISLRSGCGGPKELSACRNLPIARTAWVKLSWCDCFFCQHSGRYNARLEVQRARIHGCLIKLVDDCFLAPCMHACNLIPIPSSFLLACWRAKSMQLRRCYVQPMVSIAIHEPRSASAEVQRWFWWETRVISTSHSDGPRIRPE
eukprot:scaffold24_cov341-Pavlova_lutheri.AAC.21